jgi:hypothetical protein
MTFHFDGISDCCMLIREGALLCLISMVFTMPPDLFVVGRLTPFSNILE